MTDIDFASWRRSTLEQVETALELILPSAEQTPARLHQAMRYAVLQGGKRVRPLLAHAAATAYGAPADMPTVNSAACAVELIHAYSLVHDDLPCMDDDDLRRGKATVHVQFDEATAMLVGDALQALAFRALGSIGEQALPASLGELANAAGSVGMAGGQAIDLMAVGHTLSRDELEEMHRLKTGAMLSASVRLGWSAASKGQAVPAALNQYARAIGLAFQVVDDILDVEGDTAVLGKTAGKDAAQNKPTFVSLMGIDSAKALAASLHDQALSAVAELGEHALRLRELADLIVLRKN